jgi:hypothetical protein
MHRSGGWVFRNSGNEIPVADAKFVLQRLEQTEPKLGLEDDEPTLEEDEERVQRKDRPHVRIQANDGHVGDTTPFPGGDSPLPGPPGQLLWAVTIQRRSNRPSWTPNDSHRWMPGPSSPM